MRKEKLVTYIKKHYPTTPTQTVAKALNLSVSQVRTIAKQNKLQKCEKYKEKLQKELVIHRRAWFEKNMKEFRPSNFQEQIIFGSLLGDGYISKGANRSIHYYYQDTLEKVKERIENGNYHS